jgi:hypothetical protein
MSPQTGASPGVENAVSKFRCRVIVCGPSQNTSVKAPRRCSGRGRDIIALFVSDFLKTNTNVIYQAERTKRTTMR